jgi:hypothetical protein
MSLYFNLLKLNNFTIIGSLLESYDKHFSIIGVLLSLDFSLYFSAFKISIYYVLINVSIIIIIIIILSRCFYHD